ncbi:MAG: right-handed parallel beta-helix repeat-containing protein [Clostridia bacterium]|nr:right-handed parallel beta-helix repeat-containing protein [Clostridia bacterium]
MKNTELTPISYCTGDGSEIAPYRSADGTAGIHAALSTLKDRGGRLRLPCARYDISAPIVLDLSSTKLAGDVWACNCDPNGVFETRYGTKIRMNGMDFPAICLGDSQCISGTLIEGLGIQGDIKGMDTRPYFHIDNPCAGAGLALRAVRTDQCEVDKLSFCGLGTAIAITDHAEVDACQFTRCNMDGCGVGVYFAPRASFYARIRECIIADNPFYGVLVDGREHFIHNLEITGCHFVRNGGGFTGEYPQEAAVSLLNVSNCAIERNNFDDPGTFWYYTSTATQNKERQPQKQPLVALAVTGNKNRIRDNIFQHTRDAAMVIKGDGNILMNNISDGDVVIEGVGNQIIGLALTKPEARLILKPNATDTVILGVDESRIVRQE